MSSTPRLTDADLEHAKRIARGSPITSMLGLDDAIGEAMLGLWRAALGFDETLASWPTYVEWKVKSALLDAARRNDHLTRPHRTSLRDTTDAAVLAPVSLEVLVSDSGADPGCWAEWLARREDYREDVDLRLTIDAAVCALPGRNGAILRLWFKGATQVEIAEIFSLGKTRVCRLIREALEELRVELGITSSAELLAA